MPLKTITFNQKIKRRFIEKPAFQETGSVTPRASMAYTAVPMSREEG
jgi:hypothetical protein